MSRAPQSRLALTDLGRWQGRSIHALFNYNPPTTNEEICASALQYVRKVSGFREPSRANLAAFDAAVSEIASATGRLTDTLVTNAPPRNRAAEMARARAKARERFGSPTEG